MVNKFNMEKYRGEPRIVKKELNKRLSPDTLYFVQDMSDLFAETVPSEIIETVLDRLRDNPRTDFLLLTKNPKRYFNYFYKIPSNCILGATIETNRDTSQFSKAPTPYERYVNMWALQNWVENGDTLEQDTMISIEPIIDFDMDEFVSRIKILNPKFVYIGYDNYNNGLPEPSLSKTKTLIKNLEKFTTVRLKTIRERK